MRIPLPAESRVRDLVGEAAFARGLAYAQAGRVISTHWDEDNGRLVGHVRGSGRSVYTVHVHLVGGEFIGGVCSCPVGVSCKHVAALLLTAGTGAPTARAGALTAGTGAPTVRAGELLARAGVDAGAPAPAPAPTPAWARVLDSVLAAPRRDSPRAAGPLALLLEVQVDPEAGRQDQTRAHRLAVRPATRTDKGRWVRTGASWADVTRPYSNLALVREHRDALTALHRLLDGTAVGRSWGAPPTWLYLDRGPGAAVWAMLGELRRVGVQLLMASPPGEPVRVCDEVATAGLDLHQDGAGIAARPVVEVEGRRLDPERLGLIGLPDPVGVYSWSDDTLTLARFERPVDPRAQALLTMPGNLRVPAPTTAFFWTQYAARLSGILPLTSRDGSAHLPDPPRAGLCLQVTVRERHTVGIDWSWAYRTATGPAPARVPLGPVDHASQPWRSSDDEVALLATAATAVAGALGAGPDIRPGEEHRRAAARVGPAQEEVPVRPSPSAAASAGRLRAALLAPLRTGAVGHPGLTDWDTVTLVERVLPALRAVDGVEVVVVGELPDYREAQSPVRVVVGTGDDGPTPLGADRDWFELSVSIQVDGRDVPIEVVLRALALGEDRVLLDDGLWLRVDTPELAALRTLVEEARALADTPRGPLRVSRWDVAAWDELVSLGVVVRQAREWTQAVHRLAELADPPSHDEVPAGVRATLRPYQRAGYAWLCRLAAGGLGGVLADDMGLGKTLQLLTFAAWWRAQERGRVGPLLVVAPTSVVAAWAGEAAKFVPDLVVRTVGATAAKRGSALAELSAGADVVVTSYTLFRIENDDYQRLPWSALVLDEAQTVKNHQSIAYACARTLRAQVKVAVTGTPLENSVLELWALLGLVAPGLFPSLQRFTEHYRVPIEREGDAARLADLRRRIRPLVLRRTKEQVAADLPPRLEHVVEIELVPRHRALYDRYLARERQKVLGLLEDFDGNRFEIFRSLTLLRRLALDPSLVDDEHTGVPATKLDHLSTMLDEIVADGHRVLVFSQFTGVLGRVRDRLDARGTRYAYLDGSTTRRGSVIEGFRTGDAPVFLISLRAGGVGLTLTEADYVLLLDPWWNPAVEAQAVDRVHRIGQTRQVMVYRLVAAGTIEDKVMALKAAKARLFDSVLGGGELADARLSATDVRALLT